MSARDLLRDLDQIGATVRAEGHRLILRAGSHPIPADLVARIRQAKPVLLAALTSDTSAVAPAPGFERVAPLADGEPGLEEPCAARRGRVLLVDDLFLHFCAVCGRFGAFGYGVRLHAGRLGRWYCGEHRPRTGNGLF